MTATRPLLILIAGPYRSGTGDDPDLMAASLARLEEAAWPIFEAGHVRMIGEWVALPVLRSAGRHWNRAHSYPSTNPRTFSRPVKRSPIIALGSKSIPVRPGPRRGIGWGKVSDRSA